MSNTKIKREIADMFGFSANKIALLEVAINNGQLTYVMFDVCGVEYQASNLIDVKMGLISKTKALTIYAM